MTKKPMKIVFMGSPEFALPSLQVLIDSSHELLAVVSGTDKRRGRGKELSPTPVKAMAVQYGIPVIEADSMKDEKLETQLSELNPDLFVVVAFKILPQKLLDIPKIGSINVHASLLPKYRGAAPIHWAIAKGETVTGNSIFFLDKRVDTGSILCTNITDILPHETTGDVYERLKVMGADLLKEAISLLSSGKYTLFPQDHSLATPAPKVQKEDARLNFSMRATEVYNQFRSMTPSPGPWVEWEGVPLKVHSISVAGDDQVNSSGINDQLTNSQVGDLLIHDGRLFVKCSKGFIEMHEFQFPSKNRVLVADFLKSQTISGSFN